MPAPDELSLFAGLLESVGAPYMITGATAAILYGQPRVTNDLDVVLDLDDSARVALLRVFSETEFYVPPESVIRTEQARSQRGHFNLIHHETGYKADIYLVGSDPLHAWAMPQRRRVPWHDGVAFSVAPPEYVVLRKLESTAKVARRNIPRISVQYWTSPEWMKGQCYPGSIRWDSAPSGKHQAFAGMSFWTDGR